eukprot:m.341884 g.341884  ORF g.341884 m.341884 type:complete len:549 (-) comp20634_c0_seq1:10-1656(-)
MKHNGFSLQFILFSCCVLFATEIASDTGDEASLKNISSNTSLGLPEVTLRDLGAFGVGERDALWFNGWWSQDVPKLDSNESTIKHGNTSENKTNTTNLTKEQPKPTTNQTFYVRKVLIHTAPIRQKFIDDDAISRCSNISLTYGGQAWLLGLATGNYRACNSGMLCCFVERLVLTSNNDTTASPRSNTQSGNTNATNQTDGTQSSDIRSLSKALRYIVNNNTDNTCGLLTERNSVWTDTYPSEVQVGVFRKSTNSYLTSGITIRPFLSYGPPYVKAVPAPRSLQVNMSQGLTQAILYEERFRITGEVPDHRKFRQDFVLDHRMLIDEEEITNLKSEVTLVFVHTSGCPFSAAIAPHVFIFLAENPHIRVTMIDGADSPMVTRYGVSGFPTLLLFTGKRMIGRFAGPTSLSTIRVFVNYTLGEDHSGNHRPMEWSLSHWPLLDFFLRSRNRTSVQIPEDSKLDEIPYAKLITVATEELLTALQRDIRDGNVHHAVSVMQALRMLSSYSVEDAQPRRSRNDWIFVASTLIFYNLCLFRPNYLMKIFRGEF